MRQADATFCIVRAVPDVARIAQLRHAGGRTEHDAAHDRRAQIAGDDSPGGWGAPPRRGSETMQQAPLTAMAPR